VKGRRRDWARCGELAPFERLVREALGRFLADPSRNEIREAVDATAAHLEAVAARRSEAP
jgi:hypothetical protein